MEKFEWENFKRKVGEGNASSVIRGFVRSYSNIKTESNRREYYIRKELSIVEPDYQKLSSKYNRLKVELEAIEQQKKTEEIKAMKEAEKQAEIFKNMKHAQMQKELRRGEPQK